jgi:hypothetical protein
VGGIVQRCDIRPLFSRQIAHVSEAVLPQHAEVDGVVNALSVSDPKFTCSGNQPFGLKGLDVRVDLPVIHPDALCDVSGGVAVEVLGQVPDDGRPQGVGVEHAKGLSNLVRQSGEWLVDAGHSSILTHRRDFKKYQHVFGDGSITLKTMLRRHPGQPVGGEQ